jgi:similar to spore coat protein
MANLIQNMAGMGNMTEQVIATDFLIASKSAIKNYAAALAESTTPEVTNTLKNQLNDAINTREKITNYMMNKGYYNAFDPEQQFAMDRVASDTVMSLGNNSSK